MAGCSTRARFDAAARPSSSPAPRWRSPSPACGGEKQFTPDSFVADINEAGAGLELGSMLTTSSQGVDVYAIAFAPAAPDSPTGEDPERELTSSGTLLAMEDEDEARAEFERCSGAPDLTCFRAANTVLRFEQLDPADQARLVTALQELETIDE